MGKLWARNGLLDRPAPGPPPELPIYPRCVNIEAVIAALGGRYDADETEVIERVLRDHGGTIPDKQLIEEASLALAIHRRGRR